MSDAPRQLTDDSRVAAAGVRAGRGMRAAWMSSRSREFAIDLLQQVAGLDTIERVRLAGCAGASAIVTHGVLSGWAIVHQPGISTAIWLGLICLSAAAALAPAQIERWLRPKA